MTIIDSQARSQEAADHRGVRELSVLRQVRTELKTRTQSFARNRGGDDKAKPDV